MSKDNEKKLARVLYVDKGKTAKEVAQIVKVTEKTIGTWVELFGWRALRDAYENSPDMMIINIKALLTQLAEERMCIDGRTDIDDVKKSKRKAGIADEISKWTKALEAAQKQSIIPLGTYLKVMDSIFDAIQDKHPQIYLQLIDFQEMHIHDTARKYQ